MASVAADVKGKRPMYPEDDPAAAAEAKPFSRSDPGVGGAEEKNPAAEGEGGGADDGLLLVTADGTELRISRTAARMSSMLNGMMEDDCARGGIPVTTVDAGILRMVVAYCEKHGRYYDPETAGRDRDPFPPFPIDLTLASHVVRPVTNPEPDLHGLSSWDQEFITVGVDNTILFSIIMAADYLGIEDLVDLGCTAVADKMRGKTPEQIREVFDIENDYTTEQEAEVRRQNAWAFEDCV